MLDTGRKQNAHAPAFKMLPSIRREKRKTEGRASTIGQDRGQISNTEGGPRKAAAVTEGSDPNLSQDGPSKTRWTYTGSYETRTLTEAEGLPGR